jgi:outer membrane protein
MKTGTRIAAGLAVLISAAAGALAETPAEAIELALANSPDLESAEYALRSAESGLAAAVRDRFPVPSLSGSYQFNSADTEVTFPPPLNSSISLSQKHTVDFAAGVSWVAYAGGARNTAVRIAELAVESGRISLEDSRRAVALETAVLYRQVQAADLTISSLESGIRRIDLQLRQLQSAYQEGLASRADLLALQLSLTEFRGNLLAARTERNNAYAALAEKVGGDIEVLESGSAPSLPAIGEDARAMSTVLRAAGNAALSAEEQSRLAASANLPRLALQAQYHYGIPGANPVENEWMGYLAAGATLSWSYDWGAASARADAAGASADAARAAYRRLDSALELAVAQQTATIESMLERLELLSEAARLTGEKLDITESRYEQGMATVSDFTDATLEKTQADLGYQSMALQIVMLIHHLEAVSGLPLEEWSTDL